MTAAPRHVYLDLGTNWGDTLDLYRKGLADGAHANATNWEVYGFEAAPLLMPYVDQLVRWKNGVPGVERPVTCFPPAGSTKDRIRFSKLVGCWRTWAPKINFCLEHLFRSDLDRREPDHVLLNHTTVWQRLHEARERPVPTAAAARYTFVPAAVGGRTGTISFSRKRISAGANSRLTSGFRKGSMKHLAAGAGSSNATFDVQIVDVTSWLARNFHVDDYVLVKLDVEGAEHEIVERLEARGALSLIDVMAIECHGWSGNCSKVYGSLLRAGVKIRTDYESLVTAADWQETIDHFHSALHSQECAHLNLSRGSGAYQLTPLNISHR